MQRKTSATIFVWLFAFLFVCSAIGVIFSYFPVGLLLNPEFYKQTLVEVDIYQRLPESLASQLAGNLTPSAGDAGSGISLMVLDDQEWETVLLEIVDPTWVQSQTEGAIDQFFDILLVSPDPVNTSIDISLVDVKQRISGAEGVIAFNRIIEAQPPCSLEQLLGVLQNGLGMSDSTESILCRPPDFIISEINPIVESILFVLGSQIPDEVQIYIPFEQLEKQADDDAPAAVHDEIPAFLQDIRLTSTLIRWSPVLPIMFLLFLSVIAVRSWRDFLIWWGGTLFTTGSISLFLSFIFSTALVWVYASYPPLELIRQLSMPGILQQIGITDFFQALGHQLLLSIRIPAGTLTAVGFILLVAAYLIPRISPTTDTEQIDTNPPELMTSE